jgi:hypothetical protein
LEKEEDMLTREEVQKKAYRVLVENNSRNVAFDAYKQMYQSGWDLPPEVRALSWITKVINSDPYDAVQTGIRILATIPASIRYQPLAPSPENTERAGVVEKVCKWNLKSANRRRSRTIEAEMAKMALLYDMCAVKTVDLEYEIKQKKVVNADTKREEQALSLGRFMIIPYDSRDVYPIWSNLMLEGVLVVQHRRASEILFEFGDKASQFPELVSLAEQPDDGDWVTYYDYTDYTTRSIWVDEGRTFVMPEGSTAGRWHIDHGSNPMTFLNWSCKGGSELETDPTHKFQPLLYPVYATGAWEIKNIIQTLGVSEVIAHTGSPRFVEEGKNPQQAEVDFGRPERIAKMPAGNILKPLEPPGVDNALAGVEAMVNAQLDKEMVSAVLQGGDLPAGTAFATLNLITQTAIGVLNPAKDLAQKVLADVCVQMLQWCEFTDKPLYGYVTDGENRGQGLVVNPDEIDPKSLYLDVDLHPDGPADKAQKVATAGIMVEKLGYSQESALDEVGVEDPAQEIEKGLYEQMVQHELTMELEREMLEMQNEVELDRLEAELEMQMVAQQQAQQAAQQAQQTEGGPAGEPPGPPPGGDPFGGAPAEGMNPAEGEMPPAMFAPEQNAEGAGGAGTETQSPVGEVM